MTFFARIEQLFKGGDQTSRDTSQTLRKKESMQRRSSKAPKKERYPSSSRDRELPQVGSEIVQPILSFRQLTSETNIQYERRKQQLEAITSSSIPEADWTRLQCVVWIYHHLVDKLQVEQYCAVEKANGFRESGS
jgi:hypothetical protein